MKLMLVCTSGGHFATMKSLERFWSQHERVWVTDFKEDTRTLTATEKVHWLPYQAPRDIAAFALNLPKAIKLVWSEKPDLIVSTGASIAVNFALAAKLTGKDFTFIESLSRSKELSLSGKLIYPICNELYVQWPSLSQKYDKAVFAGHV
ncbi:MAG: PssD/Cps14F family polysaccharide biosynthesis glycosyltransferase [Cyanobacteria bacterium J06635_15]